MEPPILRDIPRRHTRRSLWGIDYAGTSPRAEFAVYGDNQYFEEYDENDNPVYINSQDADGGFIAWAPKATATRWASTPA